MIRIYQLIDPITCRIRYIGQTTQSLEHRLYGHVNCKARRHVTCWIQSLKQHGLRPKIELVLLVENKNEANNVESLLINFYRSTGYELTNSAQGGKGKAHRHSEETKARISASKMGHPPYMLGFKMSTETKAKMSAAQKGRTFTEETKARMSIAQKKRKPISNETREKMSAASKGHNRNPGLKHTDEAKVKIAAASTGRKHTEESKAKMSSKRRAAEQQKRENKGGYDGLGFEYR